MVVPILATGLAGLGGLGVLEQRRHLRALKTIPRRIHVSGTRGKSSVTRLIAAGLRAGPGKTLAKTTGTLARIILPDGAECPVYRPAGANIIEQLSIVKLAQRCNASTLVLECMAVQPKLHWVSEHKMVQATIGVITNIRPDHLDVMGPTAADVAKAIAGMIPTSGLLFTTESRYLDILARAADDRGTTLVHVSSAEVAEISVEDLAGFTHVEYADNVALALAVCRHLGIEKANAAAGMCKATPDPGAMIDIKVDFFGRDVTFVNAFAANDPTSTTMAWHAAMGRHPDVDTKLLVFNLRADRALRTKNIARACEFMSEAKHVILTGSGAETFMRHINTSSAGAAQIKNAEHLSTDELFEYCMGLCGRKSMIVGVGNIGGNGLALAEYFKNRQSLTTGPALT